MNARSRTVLALIAIAWATQAAAQVTFYELEGYEGHSFTTERQIANIERRFSDRASSAIVSGNRWEVCEDANFGGRCVVLRRGHYPSPSAMGLNDRVSSVRAVRMDARVADDRYAPPPRMGRDFKGPHLSDRAGPALPGHSW